MPPPATSAAPMSCFPTVRAFGRLRWARTTPGRFAGGAPRSARRCVAPPREDPAGSRGDHSRTTDGGNAVTIPMWVLLAFAAWTLCVLCATIGVYRWSRIFAGRATIREWRADAAQGAQWYQRAMRAHMNCVENLPVYGAVALAAFVAGVSGPATDVLALAFLAARMLQSIVHVALRA
jgi:uncharacterized MAPEG superfamily protein